MRRRRWSRRRKRNGEEEEIDFAKTFVGIFDMANRVTDSNHENMENRMKEMEEAVADDEEEEEEEMEEEEEEEIEFAKTFAGIFDMTKSHRRPPP